MGLSNGERREKVIWAVRALHSLSKQIKTKGEGFYPDVSEGDKSIFDIKRHCKELWATLFSKKGNSGFWLFGSDEEVRSEGETLWSIALYSKITGCSKPKEAMSEMEISMNKHDSDFDAFKHSLDIESLLSGNLKTIYEIYKWCQQLQYAINRYEDDFSREHKVVLNKAHTILGECFNVFQDSDKFADAYLLHKACKILYTDKYGWKDKKGKSKADELTQFLDKHAIHHSLKNAFSKEYAYRTYYLKQAYKSLVEDGSMQNRAFWMVKMSSDDFDSLHPNYPYVKTKSQNHHTKELLELIDNKKWDKAKFLKAFTEADVTVAKEKDQHHKDFTEEKDFYVKDLLGIERK